MGVQERPYREAVRARYTGAAAQFTITGYADISFSSGTVLATIPGTSVSSSLTWRNFASPAEFAYYETRQTSGPFVVGLSMQARLGKLDNRTHRTLMSIEKKNEKTKQKDRKKTKQNKTKKTKEPEENQKRKTLFFWRKKRKVDISTGKRETPRLFPFFRQCTTTTTARSSTSQ